MKILGPRMTNASARSNIRLMNKHSVPQSFCFEVSKDKIYSYFGMRAFLFSFENTNPLHPLLTHLQFSTSRSYPPLRPMQKVKTVSHTRISSAVSYSTEFWYFVACSYVKKLNNAFHFSAFIYIHTYIKTNTHMCIHTQTYFSSDWLYLIALGTMTRNFVLQLD